MIIDENHHTCIPEPGDFKRHAVPEAFIDRKFLKCEEILKELEQKSPKMLDEIKQGLTAVASYPRSVTIFGSARTEPGSKYYELARKLAGEITKEGIAVITGGGGGIMQAVNQGSHEVSGQGVGFNIQLPFEQIINPYVTHGVTFHYFFTRKFAMNFSGEVYICMPGGFGTLDEFFQILTLVQTKKVQEIPIILFGSDFWQPLVDYVRQVLLKEHETISPADLDLFTVTDSIPEILDTVRSAPPRQNYYS